MPHRNNVLSSRKNAHAESLRRTKGSATGGWSQPDRHAEVHSGYECYGQEASAIAKRLLPVGARVRLLLESVSDPVDRYGRLLRYVVRVSDGMNVNLRLVAVGGGTVVL